MIFDMSIYEAPEMTLAIGQKNRKRGGTYTNDMSSAGPGSKHRKDPSATPNIQHGLAFEKMRIVHDGGAIRAGANRILQHLLMDTCDSLR